MTLKGEGIEGHNIRKARTPSARRVNDETLIQCRSVRDSEHHAAKVRWVSLRGSRNAEQRRWTRRSADIDPVAVRQVRFSVVQLRRGIFEGPYRLFIGRRI